MYHPFVTSLFELAGFGLFYNEKYPLSSLEVHWMLLPSWFLGCYFVLPLLFLILVLILFRTVLLWTNPWLRRKFASWGPATGAPPSPASSARTPSSTRKSLTHRYLSGPSFTSQLIITPLIAGTASVCRNIFVYTVRLARFRPRQPNFWLNQCAWSLVRLQLHY